MEVIHSMCVKKQGDKPSELLIDPNLSDNDDARVSIHLVHFIRLQVEETFSNLECILVSVFSICHIFLLEL